MLHASKRRILPELYLSPDIQMPVGGVGFGWDRPPGRLPDRPPDRPAAAWTAKQKARRFCNGPCEKQSLCVER